MTESLVYEGRDNHISVVSSFLHPAFLVLNFQYIVLQKSSYSIRQRKQFYFTIPLGIHFALSAKSEGMKIVRIGT